MRKGYGPTGASYHYTKNQFAKDLASGITVVIEGTNIEFDVESVDGDTIDALFAAIDCVCYVGEGESKRQVHVLILRNREGVSIP